jgi:hypothetical protein
MRPAAPEMLRHRLKLLAEWPGVDTIAAMRRTAQKCTIVGVANALHVASPAAVLPSARSAITTNCRPVSAAADEPRMT